jgi:hypothetical protein
MFMGRDGEVIAHYFGHGSHTSRETHLLGDDGFSILSISLMGSPFFLFKKLCIYLEGT